MSEGMLLQKVILVLSFFIVPTMLCAQQEPDIDSSGAPAAVSEASINPAGQGEDTLRTGKQESGRPFVTAKKTALYSAIIPGLGQFHNRHYWKMPVVYVGVGVAVYFIHDNLTNYNKYRKIYAGMINNDPGAIALADGLPQEQVKYLQDYHRRYLDLTVLFTALGYTLQVLDAAIFAHLKGFDISDDISLRAQPVLIPQGGLGMGIVLRF